MGNLGPIDISTRVAFLIIVAPSTRLAPSTTGFGAQMRKREKNRGFMAYIPTAMWLCMPHVMQMDAKTPAQATMSRHINVQADA